LKPKLDQALQSNHLVKMTVFEPTKPCKNSQSSLDSKGFEFISNSYQKMNLEKEKDSSMEKGRAARIWPSSKSSPASPPGVFLFFSHAQAHALSR
jgi:hypothetical protein